MYATLEEFQLLSQYCGDSRASFALQTAQSMLDSIIDNQEKRQLTKTIHYSDFNSCNFRSSVFNIQSIDKINGIDYIGVINDDFKINGYKNNACFIGDIGRYTPYKTPYIDITYTAGYEIIPYDLKQAHIYLTEAILSTKNGQSIQSEKVGPISVTYSSDLENRVGSLNSILSTYML